MKKAGILVILCCLICCTACSGKKQAENAGQEIPDKTNTAASAPDESETLDDYIETAAMGCEVVKEHEDVRQGHSAHAGHITYRVDKVTVTKQQGDWVDLGIGPELDTQGKITGGASYVVVDVTVRQDGEFDFWWNAFSLSRFTENDLRIGTIEMTSAGILFSDKNIDLADNAVYQYSLPQGKNVKCSLVFTVEDEMLNEEGRHFLLEFNPTGANPEFIEPEDYSMVFLESLEDENGRQNSSK